MLTQEQSQKILSSKIKKFPKQLLILGTGWNQVLKNSPIEAEVSYKELFDVEASVPGHEGKLVIAKVSGVRVAVMVGRFHMYEGYSAQQATMPIRVFAKAGAKQLLVTAASGALHEKFRVGEFVFLNDLLTLFLSLDNPLQGPQFLDTSELFDPKLRQILLETAQKHSIPFQEGCYAYYHGPSFETPADKMALKFLGADVVGMSTVPEVLMARWLKMRVAGIALVTNLAFVKHDHKEVLAQANKASQQMVKLIKSYVQLSE